MGVDPFTLKRIQRFVEDYRAAHGQLPTLDDFATAGFSKDLVKQATRSEILEQFYVTLSNGVIRKGYKIKQP